MKLTGKVVEDVVSEVAGKDVLPLVKVLRSKSNVSEFKLAEKLKKEINTTRNMLYRLYENSLVSFIRKKDKKKGWYVYYWTFNSKRIKDLVKNVKKQALERFVERINREKSTQFYVCRNKCIRLDFEQCHEFSFKCPECGALLDFDDNSKKILELQKEITKLEKEQVVLAKKKR